MSTTSPSSAGRSQAQDSRRRRSREAPLDWTAALDELATVAADALDAGNPFAALRRRELARVLALGIGRLAARPIPVARQSAKMALALGRGALGAGDIDVDPQDRRFSDPAWRENPAFRRLLAVYLAWREALLELVDRSGLEGAKAEQARFAVMQLTEAAAPTNVLATNPAAVKRLYESGGLSLLRGARNAWGDVRHNRGMPAQVKAAAFRVGRDLAATPGQVVYRNSVFELLQYSPAAESVHERGLLVVSSQVNKYYVADLSPGRSLVEHAASEGLQPFAISWRNPTAAQRAWNLDTYVESVSEAIDVITEITGADAVNLLGMCGGGVITALLLAHLAATGNDRVASATFLVTVLDWSVPSQVDIFSSPRLLKLAQRRVDDSGVLDGGDLGAFFAWLRPTELVWSFYVNQWLIGDAPPTFDLLYWNADSTRLPAGAYRDYVRQFKDNPLPQPGMASALGTPVDLRRIQTDSFVVAGQRDHITPWLACYQTTQLLGGESEFVLASAGHVATVVSAPSTTRASFRVGPPRGLTPEQFLRETPSQDGSWWPCWTMWLGQRSGERRPAPESLGSLAHPPLDPAPGRYVHQC
jgi:polyhydroxyalkanoate synthase